MNFENSFIGRIRSEYKYDRNRYESNLTDDESKLLYELSGNDKICVMKPDKGGGGPYGPVGLY